jgi:GTP-binding protein EngB required for normal cell division
MMMMLWKTSAGGIRRLSHPEHQLLAIVYGTTRWRTNTRNMTVSSTTGGGSMISCRILQEREPQLLYNHQLQPQQSRGLCCAWNKKWKQKAPRKKPISEKEKQQQHNMSRGGRGSSSRGGCGGGGTKQRLLHEQRKRHHQEHEDWLSQLPENINIQQQQGGDSGSDENPRSMSSRSSMFSFIPPAVLLPTGSPHVYVAAIAAHDAGITDPKRQLFPSSSTSSSLSSPSSDNDDNEIDSIKKVNSTKHKQARASPPHPNRRALPPLFRQASFEYFSPVALKYELPGAGSSGKGSGYNNNNNRSSITIPEVAFLGRSNVGKSSLINALMGRDLARISKQPGRTQFVHYFGLVPHSVLAADQKQQRGCSATVASSSSAAAASSRSAGSQRILDPLQCKGFFVDLPGYGYAVAPDDKVDDWQEKTQMFLTSRIETGNLRRLFLLLDARHGATTFDQSIMTWLDEAAIPYTIVYTKADCVTKPTIVKHVNQTCLRYHHLHVQRQEEQDEEDADSDEQSDDHELYMSPIVHVTSSKGTGTNSGLGLRELLENIEAEFLLVPSK